VRFSEVLIVVLLEALDLDSQFTQQTHHLRCIELQLLNRESAPTPNHSPAVSAEFVAFCMPAEVVVIVEHQDFRLRAV